MCSYRADVRGVLPVEWLSDQNYIALDLTDLNANASGINFQWHDALLARWTEFWVAVMMHTPQPVPRHTYRSRMDDYMMMRFAALLVQTSPYGDQPATIGPGSVPARERNPPESLLSPNTALSMREQEAIPSILWMMVLMRHTMYKAHAQLVQSGNWPTPEPGQRFEAVERLMIFINWLNDCTRYVGLPRHLSAELLAEGIILHIVNDDFDYDLDG